LKQRRNNKIEIEIDREEKKDMEGGGNINNNNNEILPRFGNENTMNIENRLFQNITQSHYYMDALVNKTTVDEVIDEIYEHVDELTPWINSNIQNPSTCYCLMYKLYTLKPTKSDLRLMLKHKDSPYIRAIAMLYIRYSFPPEKLWGWLEPYLEDKKQIGLQGWDKNKISLGEFVKQLLTEQKWFDTLFPRIPVKTQKDISELMNEHEKNVKEREKNKPIKPATNKYLNKEFTIWDRIDIRKGDITLQQVLDYFRDEHKVEIDMLGVGTALIYAGWMMAKAKERGPKRLTDVVVEVTGKPLPPGGYLMLEPTAVDLDGNDIPDLPLVCFWYK